MPAKPSPHDYRAALLAALDFKIDRLAGQFVYDGRDFTREHFLNQQQKTKTDTPKKMQRRLAQLIKNTAPTHDAPMAAYILENTGIELENFDEWQNREQTRAASRKKPGQTRTETKVLSEKDGVRRVQIRVSYGPEPDHLEEQEAISPDGKLRLRVVQWAKGENSSTYVSLIFPTASGSAYSTQGIRPGVRAHWQDNETIVIETQKEYKPDVRHHEIRSGTHVVRINYVEY